jgi:hypothetical protein
VLQMLLPRTCAILLLLSLSSCSPTPRSGLAKSFPDPSADVRMLPGQCQSHALADLIGRVASPSKLEDAMRRSKAGRIRVLPPGAAMAMDLSTDRLTVETDGKRILRAYCA